MWVGGHHRKFDSSTSNNVHVFIVLEFYNLKLIKPIGGIGTVVKSIITDVEIDFFVL